MKKDTELVAVGAAAVILVPAVIAAMSVYRGFVLSVLWGWFMVPTFHLPVLRVPEAIGIAIIVGFIVPDSASRIDGAKRYWWVSYLAPGLALVFGWIVHLFM